MPQLLKYTQQCVEECLFYRLLELLAERGWYKLGLAAWIKSKRILSNGFQEVSYRLLVQGGFVAPVERIQGGVAHEVEHPQYGRFSFIFGSGETRADAAYFYRDAMPSNAIKRDELISKLPDKAKPLIIVDMAQLHLHSMDEASSLRRQLAALVGVVRMFLWDYHVVLTNSAEGVRAWLKSFISTPYVRITSLSTDDVVAAEGLRRCILLDPNVEHELSKDDVLSADAFVVGGIVDKRPRPGATLELKVELCERRRISLRGSLVGVPNTINSIVEAVLRARYIYEGNVERALYDVIPPHEARIRAFAEIMRVIRGQRGAEVSWDLYCELVKWLPLRPRDFEKAARMAGARVTGVCTCCE